MIHIAAILTCHNRREKTISCLSSLLLSELPPSVNIDTYLTDDGSTDGTEAAVRKLFPTTKIFRSDGASYWNGGMRIAFAEALKTDADFYLWINDDTELGVTAVSALIETYDELERRGEGANNILVGSTQDRLTGQHTYGGLNRKHALFRPVTFNLARPQDVPVQCDTMNGNCVLIPRSVALLVGNLESGFVHSMGDTDYGLRARSLGCRVWITPGYAGWCSRNSIEGTFIDDKASLSVRLKRVLGPKGMPMSAWWLYVRRHGGVLAPLLWAWPYVKAMLIRRKV